VSRVRTYVGDCLDVLDFTSSNYIDSIVTDPPYGLSFMGKKWDYDVPSVDVWRECLRVLKPGGYLLAFSGTRTYHRMVVAIEDAGFEVRDQIGWVYGSGFPKSHNGLWGGTALKPAWEPICVARKPLIGTIEQNWRAYGTGALNIDGCRVETDENLNGGAYAKNATQRSQMWGEEAGNSYVRGGAGEFVQPAGRWPANLIHDGSDEVLECFPDAPGQIGAVSATAPSDKTSNVYGRMKREGEPSADSENSGAVGFKMKPGMRRMDTGSAARFFYCAKAGKKDRDEGLDHLPAVHRPNGNKWTDKDYRVERGERPASFESGPRRNVHPTVKPTELMRYLCRLVTPSNGIVLDPFMGSGSTGKAAVLEGFRFISVERESEYVKIAQARIEHAMRDEEL
jgi:DNA modification methylase